MSDHPSTPPRPGSACLGVDEHCPTCLRLDTECHAFPVYADDVTPPRLKDLRKVIRGDVPIIDSVTPADLLAVLTSMGAEVIDTSDTIGWWKWGRYRYREYQGEYVVIRRDAVEGTE